ncbi:MAG TPA: BON domain-containing protein [Bryobacteraceae bacterium]|nr:BON domain-containing protein [Bryobacteraceae bacterium]
MGDRELREAVEDALDWEPIINSEGIGVSVKDGVVTLTGRVSSFPEKREAEKIAGMVRGARAVVCELEVALPSRFHRSDEEIAQAAANAIAWNTLLPKDKIQVWVDNGRVTLEGMVDWQYQRKSASKCVRYLDGVKDVNNHIVVRPNADQVAVKTQIEAALLRHAQLDADSIRVDVRGDRVILSGHVTSWAEREAAEQAAWGSPGVCDVENLLQVNPVSPLVPY